MNEDRDTSHSVPLTAQGVTLSEMFPEGAAFSDNATALNGNGHVLARDLKWSFPFSCVRRILNVKVSSVYSKSQLCFGKKRPRNLGSSHARRLTGLAHRGQLRAECKAVSH